MLFYLFILYKILFSYLKLTYICIGSLASLSKSACTSVGRADRTEVILSVDHKGFGFMLQGPSSASEALSIPPYISCIDHGSPAER